MADRKDMTGFADGDELEAYKDQGSGFVLGRIHDDHGVNFDARFDDDRHLFMVAGSRGGKGRSLIIPNLIEWTGGVLCIDPKGENAEITAMRRGRREHAQTMRSTVTECLEQEVAILDPFHAVRGPARIYRVNYDPLYDIEVGKPNEASQIMAIAGSIVIADKGSGAHFSESAETILAGLIEAVVHKADGSDRSLSFCRRVALQGFKGIKAYLKLTDEEKTPAGLADDAYGIMDSVGEEEGGSFVSTLSRQLKWLADPRVQSHVSASQFSLVDAMRNNQTVYICIPPSRIPAMSRWMRTLVRIAIEAKMNAPQQHTGERTLFMLDEFFALGHLQLVEDSAAYLAGYGIKLVPVVQNIGQVKKLYDKNWETFLGNAGGILAWSLNDHETESYISDRMGRIIGWEETYNESRSRQPMQVTPSNLSSGYTMARQERVIRTPSELHFESVREEYRAFMISALGRPLAIERIDYDGGGYAGLYDDPDAITTWENALSDEDRAQLDAQ